MPLSELASKLPTKFILHLFHLRLHRKSPKCQHTDALGQASRLRPVSAARNFAATVSALGFCGALLADWPPPNGLVNLTHSVRASSASSSSGMGVFQATSGGQPSQPVA